MRQGYVRERKIIPIHQPDSSPVHSDIKDFFEYAGKEEISNEMSPMCFDEMCLDLIKKLNIPKKENEECYDVYDSMIKEYEDLVDQEEKTKKENLQAEEMMIRELFVKWFHAKQEGYLDEEGA